LIGFLLLALPTALLALPPIPVSYQGAPMSLPVSASSGYLLQDVAVDSAGTVYILDSANNQVIVENQDYLGLAAAGGGAQGPPGYPGNGLPSGVITCSSGITPAGLLNPQAMTVTGSGTLYIADYGNKRVVSVNLTTGACSVVGMGPGSTVTLSSPQGIAVSEYGDIFISDSTGGLGAHGQIICIPSTTHGGSATPGVAYVMMDLSTTIDGNTWVGGVYLPPYVVNGVWNPAHIAWDNYDDILFIADYGNSRILAASEQWISGGGGQQPFEIETSGAWNWPQLPTGANLQRPYGITVDSVGNLYFTDVNSNGVYELPHNGVPNPPSTNWNTTNYALNTGNQSYNGSLSDPNSVYVDQWGTVYVVDTGVGPGPTTGHDRVIVNVSKANGLTGIGAVNAVNFYHLPLNLNKTEWQQLAFVVSNGVDVAAASAFTGGAEFLDFNISDNSSPTCTSGFTGNGSNYCYVWVSFKPTAPGLRRGSVVLFGTIGQELANVPVFGVGSAPQLEFFPTGYGAAISTGTVNTVEPMQIALDGNNNMFVANYIGDVVVVPPQGGTGEAIPSSSTGSSPVQVVGVAVDGAGNVFLADHQGSRIWVVKPPYNANGYMPLVIDGLGANPLNEPMALNFDPAGNLYIADFGNNRVVEVSGIYINGTYQFEGRGTVISTNGAYLGQGYSFWSTTTNPNGLRSVTGVAVDPLMNVYIADSVAGNIVTAPQSTNQIAPGYLVAGRLNWPYSSNGFSGVQGVFKSPQGVTSDGMGNLYVADAGNSRVVAGNFQTEFGNRWTGQGVTVASNVATPGPLGNNLFGVTVDPWGNVFVPDYANNRIAAYYPTVAPTLNFASTNVGSTSSDSPKTVKLWNIGNERLLIPGLAAAMNPSISANFTYGPTSTCAQLASGSSSSVLVNPGFYCTIIASFVPTVGGSITGNITVTDNNLYPAGYTSSTTVNTIQTLNLTGNGTGADFVIAVPNPNSAIVDPGGTATFVLTFTPVGSATFLEAITFSVSGYPTGSTVNLTPASIAKGTAGPVNVTLTVTPPSIVDLKYPQLPGRKLAPLCLAMLLPIFGFRRVRRALRQYPMVLLLLVALAGFAGLSACSGKPGGYFGASGAYDYSVTVTATNADGVSHSTSVTLAVN
jgi:sugar lactone lactonase YvrE